MLKLAVIGTGGIAQKAYFPLLAVMPDIRVIAVHSRTLARAQEAAARWQIPFFTDKLEDILAQQPDAALVVSSTASHFTIIKYLLENGIDVYSEKSLTENSDQSFELAKIAQAYKRILAVGFNRRYSLLYQQAKEIIGDRHIELAVIQKHRSSAFGQPLFEHYLDDTIHQIDLMRFYCGDVQALHTDCQEQNGKLASAVSIVRLPRGGQGIITICNQAGAWQESASLHTRDFSIHIDAFRQMRIIYGDHETLYGTDRAGKWVTSLRERGFYGEVDHFLSCVRSRENPLTNADEAAKTQELLEALVRASGRKIRE